VKKAKLPPEMKLGTAQLRNWWKRVLRLMHHTSADLA